MVFKLSRIVEGYGDYRASKHDSDILPRLPAAMAPAKRATGDWLMGIVDLWRRKAEDCLEKAHAISDRQRARLLLVQAHNYLKKAEEKEAQQLSARRPADTRLIV